MNGNLMAIKRPFNGRGDLFCPYPLFISRDLNNRAWILQSQLWFERVEILNLLAESQSISYLSLA